MLTFARVRLGDQEAFSVLALGYVRASTILLLGATALPFASRLLKNFIDMGSQWLKFRAHQRLDAQEVGF